jgi:putative SbcD/Mre11-related phosphoesterase
MKIAKNIEIIDLALKYKDTLIISDLQIGIEGELQEQGILVPVYQFDDVFARLKDIIEHSKGIKRIIINGDLKHEFGSITNQEWRYILRILDYLLERMDVVIVKGNHDIVIKPIAKKRNVKVVDYYKIDDIIILHGHKILEQVEKLKP